jgi:hypothetical protein
MPKCSLANSQSRPIIRPRDGCAECIVCRRANRLAWHGANPKRRSSGLGNRFGFFLNYNFPKIKFCPKGHAIIGDNFRIDGRWIRCLTCLRIYVRAKSRNGNLGERVVRNVLTALQEGKTFNNIAGRKGNEYVGGSIVDVRRLNRFCDQNVKLGKRIRALAEKNRVNAMAERNSQRNLITTANPSIVRASGDIMDVISAAVSRHLPRDLRDDAIQNIWMAVLEGRLKRATSRHRLTSLSAPSIRATTTLGDRARSICRFISRATPR